MNSRFLPVLKESIGILGIVTMTVGLLCQAFGTNADAFISFGGSNGEETAAVVSMENLDPSDDALEKTVSPSHGVHRPYLALRR